MENRLTNKTVAFRFPRTWLGEWRDVQERIERLIESWRPTGLR